MGISSISTLGCSFHKTTFSGIVSCGSQSIQFDSTQAPIKEIGIARYHDPSAAVDMLGLRILNKDVVLFDDNMKPLEIGLTGQIRFFLENDEWIRIELDGVSYWADGSGVSQRTQCPVYRQIADLTLSKVMKRSRKVWEAYAKESFPKTCSYFLYNTKVALGLVAHPLKVFHLNNQTVTNCQVESDATQVNSIPLIIDDALHTLELENSIIRGKKKKDRFSTLLYDGNPLRLVLVFNPQKGAARRKREAKDREEMERNDCFFIRIASVNSSVMAAKQFCYQGEIKHEFHKKTFRCLLKKRETEFPYDLTLHMSSLNDPHVVSQSFNLIFNGNEKLIVFSDLFGTNYLRLNRSIELSTDSKSPGIISIDEIDDKKGLEYSLAMVDNVPPVMFQKRITNIPEGIRQKLTELFHSLELHSHQCTSCCCRLLEELNPEMSKEQIKSIHMIFTEWLSSQS